MGILLALGQYFTFTVNVSADQDIVTRGPYRVLRHPGYTGGLRNGWHWGDICHWVGLAGFGRPCLISSSGASGSRRPHCSRQRVPPTERMRRTKRLVPLVW